ncbi:MAG TPA: rRNA maturation RNase YbeY [Tepidisphaeraceae bacterium]|jgi:probable rRNA maturation factor|nr:rRNA maturation RNase YbeY [Tepidisphaeraceae bacterium]
MPQPKVKNAAKTNGPARSNAARPLDLTITAATGKRFVPFLRKHLKAAHVQLRPALSELSLALVGDAHMSKLHQQFMNIAGPTDVLTFPLEFDDRGREIAGEVVICVDEAARQAKRRGTPVERELLLYALHGMLHLSGFDDRTDPDFRRMHRTEDQILVRLGLGPVFKGGNGNPASAGATRKPANAGNPTRNAGKSPRKARTNGRNPAVRSLGA